MPALDGAFALADGPHGAVLVGHHLDLDVVAGGQVAFAEHRGIAERGLAFPLGGSHFGGQRTQFAHHPHAAATAAGGRLDQHRQLRGGHRVGIKFGQHRNTGCGHQFLGLDLGAHGLHRGHRWADPDQTGLLHGLGEIRVLGQESVSRVDGVGAGRMRRGDQLTGIQVAVAALQSHPEIGLGDMWGPGVGIGVHRDGADAQATTGGEHPAGDLATVGDQNSW